jgi:hypothetical protein
VLARQFPSLATTSSVAVRVLELELHERAVLRAVVVAAPP